MSAGSSMRRRLTHYARQSRRAKARAAERALLAQDAREAKAREEAAWEEGMKEMQREAMERQLARMQMAVYGNASSPPTVPGTRSESGYKSTG